MNNDFQGYLIFGAIVAAIILFFYIRAKLNAERIAKRRAYLFAKYNNMEIVDRIMAKKIWQDMTSEMLIDSWGYPEKIDNKVYKTKTKDTYKYNSIGRRQYAQRVFVEDERVVGWDTKRL